MIVVGAGIIGLSCAWRLAQAGIDVLVCDAGRVGGEASWAGAGMLAPGGELDSPSPLAEMALRSLAQYPAFVEELQSESGVAIDYRQCGAVDLAATAVGSERQIAMGIASETRTWRGRPARFYPDDSLVDPRDLTRALAIALRRRGVEILEDHPLSAVPSDEDVLIAAGAWSSSLLPGLEKTWPVRGHLIGYRRETGLLHTILRDSETYLVQRSSGLLIAGSTTEQVGFDRNVNPEIVRDIHQRAARLLPDLAYREPDLSWIGFRPAIEGGIPAIGRVDGTRVWTAFGHYRNGILLAPETARLIAAAIIPAADRIL